MESATAGHTLAERMMGAARLQIWAFRSRFSSSQETLSTRLRSSSKGTSSALGPTTKPSSERNDTVPLTRNYIASRESDLRRHDSVASALRIAG